MNVSLNMMNLKAIAPFKKEYFSEFRKTKRGRRSAFDIENDEFCIINDELCIKNDELCIKNDEFCIKNDEFCINNDGFCIKNDEILS